jgi:hypothetical protein
MTHKDTIFASNKNVKVMETNRDYEMCVEEIEEQIIAAYNSRGNNLEEMKFLLELRKRIMNRMVLRHLEEILPVIEEFNDALRDALKEMYDHAHELYNKLVSSRNYPEDIELTSRCLLDWKYPKLHPIQKEDRQELWEALCDDDWQAMYASGVFQEVTLPSMSNQSFESFIGMNCPPPNWNEGLDRELTKDMHLICQFHNLFEHTNFALTDFIYVRKFETTINVELTKEE